VAAKGLNKEIDFTFYPWHVVRVLVFALKDVKVCFIESEEREVIYPDYSSRCV